MSQFRVCNTCNIPKVLEDFHKDKHNKLGVTTICKDCTKDRYKANSQKYLDRSAKNRKTFKGKAKILFNSCKKRSEKLGLPFELTLEWVENKLKGVCEISGMEFTSYNPTNATIPPYAPSIDKIIPSKGYTIENSRMICFIINQAKRDWDNATLLHMCKAVTIANAPPDKYITSYSAVTATQIN